MAELLGREAFSPKYVPPRPGDVKHSLGDLTKSRAELGFEPIVNFEDGLKDGRVCPAVSCRTALGPAAVQAEYTIAQGPGGWR